MLSIFDSIFSGISTLLRTIIAIVLTFTIMAATDWLVTGTILPIMTGLLQ